MRQHPRREDLQHSLNILRHLMLGRASGRAKEPEGWGAKEQAMGPEVVGELVVDSFGVHLQRRHTRCCLHFPEKDQKDVERLTAAELLGLS